MKEAGLLPSSVAGGGPGADGGLFGKARYKFWALAAIILLAFWSIFTGTVTLKWSAADLDRLADDLDAPLRDDLDVLEVEEREKVVRRMWDVYVHSRRAQLPRFWQEAFEAAYEEMASEDPTVRDAAVAEIAKMSMRVADLEPPPSRRSTTNAEKNSQEVIRTNTKSSLENQ